MTVTFIPIGMISRPLRTGHSSDVVSWDYVNSDVRPWWDFSLSSPRCRDCRFATTIVEQVEIRIAKVTVCYAVNKVMETGLRKAEPCWVIKHFIGDILRGSRKGNREDDSEWQPEKNERQVAVKVTSDKREIWFIHRTRLKCRLSHELLRIDNDPNMNEERDEEWK